MVKIKVESEKEKERGKNSYKQHSVVSRIK